MNAQTAGWTRICKAPRHETTDHWRHGRGASCGTGLSIGEEWTNGCRFIGKQERKAYRFRTRYPSEGAGRVEVQERQIETQTALLPTQEAKRFTTRFLIRHLADAFRQAP